MCGQSNRPMLNGGLSPLRYDRKSGESKTIADLRIQSTGIAAANFINNYPGGRTTAILRSLPPKVCAQCTFPLSKEFPNKTRLRLRESYQDACSCMPEIHATYWGTL